MSNTITATAANVWTFAPDAVTVNGRTFPASYSLAALRRVRVRHCQGRRRCRRRARPPAHQRDLAHARGCRRRRRSCPKGQQARPRAGAACPRAGAARPRAGAACPRAGQARPRAGAARPRAGAAHPRAGAARPRRWQGVDRHDDPGQGWSIAFDADAGRTRVQVEGTPTDAQRSAIEQAGFYWSSQLKSWNKKLTCKAYRAARRSQPRSTPSHEGAAWAICPQNIPPDEQPDDDRPKHAHLAWVCRG